MAKSTAKKKTSSNASASAKPSVQAEKRMKESSTSTMLKALLVIVIVQAVLTLGILIGMLSAHSNMDETHERIEAMDSFFATNVDGYNSPSAETGSVTAGSGSQATTGNSGTTTTATIDIEGEPTKGSLDAPVTVIEFSDYECPFCGRFYSQTYGQLMEEYVDTGKVRFVFKDFPLSFHPQAEPAAIAANCVQKLAGDEMYFEYHDTLFENQNLLGASNYKAWAEELGLDGAAFETCTQDPAMAAEVQGDLSEGTLNGVSGTPSFFINGELIVGAQPYSVIKQAIDAQLNS
jgi:protein-disulfide isomerase